MTEELEIKKALKDIFILKSGDLDIELSLDKNNNFNVAIGGANNIQYIIFDMLVLSEKYQKKISSITFCNLIFDLKFITKVFSLGNTNVMKNSIDNTQAQRIRNTSYLFKKCVFKNSHFEFNYIKFTGSIIFAECQFKETLVFKACDFSILIFNQCELSESVIFNNVIFNGSVDFNTKNRYKISFNNTTFYNRLNFNELGFKNADEVKFLSVVFNNSVNFDIPNKKSMRYNCKLTMVDVVFEKSVQFSDVRFKNGDSGDVVLKSLEFKSDIILMSYFLKNNYKDNIVLDGFIFHKKINFDEILISDTQEIEIKNCNFKDKFEFPKQKEYKQKIKIIDTIFDDRVDFVENAFLNDLMIKNCVFNKDLSFAKSKFLKCIKFMPIDTHLSRIINIVKFFSIKRECFEFIENKVKDNIDFSDVSFEISPNFQSSVFEKLVILYKTKFKEIPNFYSASFSSSAVLDMPLVDIKDYSFSHLKDEIKNKNDLIDIKGVRECLNIFKNALLKTNNILEASKYKVLELYAKELELDYKLKNKENKEEKITIKERFDRWFLKLNRATSDHHTDFLKILLFTLSVIGGYFMINFGLSLEIVANNFDYLVSKAQPIENYTKMVFNSFDLKNFAFSTLCVLCFIVYITLVLTFSKFKKLLGILGAVGIIGIVSSPSIITPFLGAFSEDARNHYLYKAIDDLDDKKALELARIILPNDKDLKEFEPSKTILSKNAKLKQISIFDKTDLSVNFIYEQSNQDKNEQSVYKAKKTLKDYKDELKSSKLLDESPELKRAVAIDGGVSRLNIAYYLVLAFCIFALQKTMRKNSIIPS